MPTRLSSTPLFVLLLAVAPALAQDFRVTTRLYDDAASRPETVIGRTWSVFHAGKVYDYVDTVSEMTIYEPSLKRFRFINQQRMLSTTLHFDDIETVIYQQTSRASQAVTQVGSAGSQQAAARQFQLQPVFEQSFDSASQRLQLKSEILSYDVKCAPADKPYSSAYLDYADWASRLNFVLHHQLLPNPRLALNAALRKRTVVPVELRLQSPLGRGLNLRVMHQYVWKLDDEDRRKVSHYEALLQNPNLKTVSFDEYQRALAEQTTKPN